jgi:hypothetical protein
MITRYYETINTTSRLGTFETIQQTAYNVVGDVIKRHPDLNLTTPTIHSSCAFSQLATFVFLELGTLFSQPTISSVVKHAFIRGYLGPINISVIQHPRLSIPRSNDAIVLLDEGTLPLFTTMYSSEKYMEVYKRFLDKILSDVFGPSHPFLANDIIDVETWISTKYIPTISTMDDVDIMSQSTIRRDLGIDMYQIIGYDASEIAVYNKRGLTRIIRRISDGIFGSGGNNVDWRSFWAYQIILAYSWSVIDLAKTIFEFSNTIYKPSTIQPLDVYYSLALLPHTIDAYYYKLTKNQRYISFCRQLCRTYISTFIRFIEKNTWLHSDTKSKLIRKLDCINIVIGHQPDANIDIRKITTQSEWIPSLVTHYTKRYINIISSIDKPYRASMPSYMVNAFFHTSTNTIYIPSSILTSPIVNLEHDPWYSIANLGFIIGHELCHCFDTGGLLYDCMNVYHSQSLLSKSETATYKKKIKKICKYIQTQGYTNPHISNHSFSDEIVADITGFLLTEAVLKDYYSRHHIDLHTGLDRFYKQYATLWSSANRDVIDPHDNHIPNKYRVNCVLISSEYFRTHNNIPQMYDPVFIEL